MARVSYESVRVVVPTLSTDYNSCLKTSKSGRSQIHSTRKCFQFSVI